MFSAQPIGAGTSTQRSPLPPALLNLLQCQASFSLLGAFRLPLRSSPRVPRGGVLGVELEGRSRRNDRENFRAAVRTTRIAEGDGAGQNGLESLRVVDSIRPMAIVRTNGVDHRETTILVVPVAADEDNALIRFLGANLGTFPDDRDDTLVPATTALANGDVRDRLTFLRLQLHQSRRGAGRTDLIQFHGFLLFPAREI